MAADLSRAKLAEEAKRLADDYAGAACACAKGYGLKSTGTARRDELLAAIDRLAADQASAQAPQGWKLVPIEPTQEMCQQGQWKAQEWPKFPLRISPIYKAMLDAAPPIRTPSSDGGGVGEAL